MERFTISKLEKQTIYEIYRACRLCGAGGGYRMPIIQNIVDLESTEVELRQKIQDCLQLEVRPDDRMPPLICELCVDKLNDFHNFLEMARQTNIRTRTRLGLPLQAAKKGEPDPGDCILGVTEPLCVDEPSKKSKAGPKCSKKIKNEPDAVKIKEEANTTSASVSRSSSVSSRSSKAGRRAATPPRPSPAQTRVGTPKEPQVTPDPKLKSRESKSKEAKLREVRGKEVKQKEVKEKEVRTSQGISRKELAGLMQDSSFLDESVLIPRSLKRAKDVEPPKPVVPPKRARTTTTLKEPIKEPVKEPTPPPPPPPRPKPRPKSKQEPKPVSVPQKPVKPKTKAPVAPPKVQEEAPPPKPSFKCSVCDQHLKTVQAVTNHMKSHLPNYTKLQNACNPCGKWFVTTEEAAAHHRYHRAATFPYHCRRCFEDYRLLTEYDQHIENNKCVPYAVVPDVKCEQCWTTFATRPLMDAHKCPGVDGRPGGKCSKCSKYYVTSKNLKKHESTCNQKKKRDLIADPDVLRRLKPMQVRISRCDDLLTRVIGDYYDVSRVKPNHGLDRLYLYPYISHKLAKIEPLKSDSTVAIHGPIKDEFERENYIHWDSEDSDSDSVVRKVDALSTICIKKLFSINMIGKVPRKKRRVKNEVFDSTNDFASMCNDLNNIINSLSNDLENSSADKSKNNNLVSSLNDIVGVTDDKDVGNETVDRNEILDKNDSTENDSGTVLNESEISNDNLGNDQNNTEVDEVHKSLASKNDTELNIETNNEQNDEETEVDGNEKCTDDMETSELESQNNLDIEINHRNEELNTIGKDENNFDTNEEATITNEEKITNNTIADSELPCNEVFEMNNTNGDLNRIKKDKNSFGVSEEETIVTEEKITDDMEADSELPNNEDLEMNNSNDDLNRIDRDENSFGMNEEAAFMAASLQETHENKNETPIVTEATQNVIGNGVLNHENYFKTNHDCNVEVKKPEEGIKIVNKESPIKHSIENLIGDTDRNPEKYINEVISSIEDIIMKNPRNEDDNREMVNGEARRIDTSEIDDERLMEALDAQIDDRDKQDHDKITLEDLLPKEDRSLELDAISEDDFNFDA